MPRTLFVVDLTNLAARCSLGGPVAPPQAAETACRMVARTADALGATHLVGAVDGPGKDWRHALTADLPEPERYKYGRSLDTRPYSDAVAEAAVARGWCVLREPAVQADDVIATVVHLTAGDGAYDVIVYSGDGDLEALAQTGTDLRGSVVVCRPMPAHHPAGPWELRTAADVCRLRGVADPAQLADFTAIAGEASDNIAGLVGRTEKGKVAERNQLAKRLLAQHGSLEGVLAAGAQLAAQGWPVASLSPLQQAALQAHRLADHLRRARTLAALRSDVPLPPLASRLMGYVATPSGGAPAARQGAAA